MASPHGSDLLCEDLLKAAVGMLDRVNIDVTTEIDKVFGPELLQEMRKRTSAAVQEDEKESYFFRDDNNVSFNNRYPRAFLEAFVATVPGKKMMIKKGADVDEKFVLQHGSSRSILTHPSIYL
jgi:hypothetical protein